MPAKRKAAADAPNIGGQIQGAWSTNLTAKELDELIKTAAARKSAEIAGARASFLDEVKAKGR